MWMDPFKTMLKLPNGKNRLKIFKEWETDPLREAMFQKCAQLNEEFFLAQKNNITEKFQEYIKYRIRKKANMLIAIVAPPGEGKSFVGLWIDSLWQRAMKEILEFDAKIEFAFDSAQTRTKLSQIRDGDLVHKDEDTTLEGRGKTTAEAEERNFVETMRFTRKSMVICAPHIALLSGMTTLLEVIAKFTTDDSSKFQTRVLVHQLKEDTLGGSAKFIPIGYIIADINNIDPKLVERYNKEKEANFRKIEKNRGAVSSQSKEDLKVLKKYAKKILRIALKHKWPSNSHNPEKNRLDNYFREADIPLNVDANDIKNLVVDMYREKHILEEISVQIENPTQVVQNLFNPDPESLLNLVKNQNPNDPNLDRGMDIYRMSLDPLKTGRDAMDKYQISAPRVRQIKQEIVGKIAELRGNQYENFLVPHLQAVFAKVTHMGGSGQPDFICEERENITIFSIKCYDFNRQSYSIPYTESHAELEYARDLFTKTKSLAITVICHCFNMYDQKIYEFIFDSQMIQVQTPYKNRSINFNLGQFSRDPSKDPWIRSPK